MATLYKSTFSKPAPADGVRCTVPAAKWYGRYTDADGVARSVPLSADKAATKLMLSDLVRQTEPEKAGLTTPFAPRASSRWPS